MVASSPSPLPSSDLPVEVTASNLQKDFSVSTRSRRSSNADSQGGDSKPSRAGRNLPAAIGVGVLLGASVALTLIWFVPGFIVLVCLVATVALYELGRALKHGGRRIELVPISVGGWGILISAYQLGLEAMLAAAFVTATAALVWRMIDTRASSVPLYDVLASTLAVMYVPFLAGFVMLMLAEIGSAAVAILIIVTMFSDTGGYATGVLLGKHPMAPSISPKKSWEGFAGSLVWAVGAATVTMIIWGHGAWWNGVILGVLTAIFATIGDLSESLLKRDLGVKDMGTILPGHGGMLDRVDSLLVVAPVCYLVLRTIFMV